jgi:aspartate racemase
MRQVVTKRNAAPSKSSQGKTVHALFEEQVAETPDAIAVLFEERSLTYAQLNAQANRLAHQMIRLGVGRGSLISLCMERSPEVIVAILGILKAGAAYVPLDPAYPDERLAFMLSDTAAPLVLAHRPTAGRLVSLARQTRILPLDTAAAIDREPSSNPAIGATVDDLAYVIYTSGSMGTPKGVLVPHRAVIRTVRDTDYCCFGPEEVFLHLSPLSFDASTFEIWGSLLNGSRLALLEPGLLTLDALGATIRRYGVTTIFLTTALFNLAVEQRVPELKLLHQLLMGGELVSPGHVQRALAELIEGRLLHVYGPTESTTFACCFPISKDHPAEKGVPIGRPISNTSVYVLDEQLRPVPVGMPGELYIGGDGLARGYLNNPELTQERFVPDPFGKDPAARLYRTGDRVRYLEDGNLDFLGRFDNQVKIRGHRIEPGEIEATLLQHPDVRQAVVTTWMQPHGEKQLVAYVVITSPDRSSAEELKRYLTGRLPHYMVPPTILLLDRLPLNLNGKVDRAALPMPDQAKKSKTVVGAAVGELEEKLMRLWSRILNCCVGLDDNFFDLGGTSLRLIELHLELSKLLGRELSIMKLFEHATVRSLAGWLSGNEGFDPAFAEMQDRAKRQKEAFARHSRLKGNRA